MSDLLGVVLTTESEPISIELDVAEQAMRELHHLVVKEIALEERRKDRIGDAD